MNKRTQYIVAVGISATVLIVVVLFLAFSFDFGGDSDDSTNADGGTFATGGDRDLFPSNQDVRDVSSSTLSSTQWERPLPLMRKLSSEPVAGATTILRAEDGVLYPFARYIERASGHIHDSNLAALDDATTISLTTIPRIQQAVFAPMSSTTLAQYFDDSGTTLFNFLGTLMPNDTELGEDATLDPERDVSVAAPFMVTGEFLPQDAEVFTFSPDGTELFYLTRTSDGSVGYVHSLTTNTRRMIWRHPLKQLTAAWEGPSAITIHTKPSYRAPGALYSINSETGVEDVVVSNLKGLTGTISPDGEYVVYAHTDEQFPTTQLLYRDVSDTTVFPLVTLPEKCAWHQSATSTIIYCGVPKETITKESFPDDWYQGKTFFNDTLWRIDVDSGEAWVVADPVAEVGQRLDIVDPHVDPTGSFIIFRSKRDNSLWSVALTGEEQ